MTTSQGLDHRQLELLEAAVARLRASVMAVVFGMVGGTGLLVATVWLVLRDGPKVGRHLGLLRHYFPGYSVSWPGALVGFFYGALAGAVLGYALAWIYNRLVEARSSARG